MILPLKYIKTLANKPVLILDPSISFASYCKIDLSVCNEALTHINVQDAEECQSYITSVLLKSKAQVAYGGYLEKRNLYGDKSSFSLNGNSRNIHLGMDFWTLAGTKVIVPLDGTVHSFQNNETIGDYGPTIILTHQNDDFTFHTLYGHLSTESLENLYVGMSFKKGDTLATLGTSDINVNYAPHLHFQLIEDIEGNEGDYPGVCAMDTLDFYSKNCPDPNLLLRMTD